MKRLDSEILAKNIESRMLRDFEEGNVSGVSVLVAQSGKVVYKRHFGTTSPDGSLPVSDGTIYRLASMTKPVTAAAIMILCDRGLLSLDEPIERYLPAFSSLFVAGEDSPISEKVTLRHLLSHTSGIGSGKAWDKYMKSASRDQLSSVSAFADFISRGPLGFHPSSQEMYSALAAFSVMVAIIEKVSGLSAEEFFQKEIFIPCSMTDTTFLPTAEQWSRVIAMSDKKDGRCVLGKTFDDCVFCDIPASACLGGAGLISTLDDYANFAEMLRSGGTFGGKRILSKKAVVEMATPQAPFVIPTQKHWGLSFGVTTDTHPRLERGCFGWSGAFGTVFWVDPANDVVAIYMKNSYYDGGEGCCTSNGFEEAVANALI